jgi:rhodanese-related sulfurtransferase
MKNISSILFLLLLICTYNVQAQDGSLVVKDFEEIIRSKNPQILDVRTAGEFQNSHLKNSLQADWMNKDQFADRTQYLDKNKPLLVYCTSGSRSAAAAKWLLGNGFTDVQNLKGGLTSWKLEGKPVEATVSKLQLSIENYNILINSGDIVLIDFGAEWCPPCKKMEPVLLQLQNELPGQFTLVKIDGGNDIDVMKAQNVNALPVFIIYKKGKEVWRKQGVVELSELKEKLTK